MDLGGEAQRITALTVTKGVATEPGLQGSVKEQLGYFCSHLKIFSSAAEEISIIFSFEIGIP